MSEDADSRGNVTGCCARCDYVFDLTLSAGVVCPNCAATTLRWARKHGPRWQPSLSRWFYRPERFTPEEGPFDIQALLTDDDRALLKGMHITLSKKENR